MNARDIVGRRRRRPRGPQLAQVAALALLALALAPLAAVAAGAAALLAVTRDVPDAARLEQLPALFAPTTATTWLYAWDAPDATGLRHPVRIDEIADPRLSGAGWVRPADLPPYVSGALLAALEPSFLAAEPPDLPALVREWRAVPDGASSPLVAYLIASHLRDGSPAEPDDARRTRQDWFLGRQIERRYSREQILEWALNTRYFGHLAYGIEAAARVYFGKGAANLTAGEAALLAVAARDPAANPFDDPAAARAGQIDVLAMMAAMGALPVETATQAVAAPLALAPPPGSDSAAPAFAWLARRELERILGSARLLAGGWQVETTLELVMQAQAVCVAHAYAARLAGDLEAPSGGRPPCPAANSEQYPVISDQYSVSSAVVVLNPATGEIEALAGADALSPHPTGSATRPLIYLTALSEGYTAATLAMDAPTIYLQEGQPWSPRNADGGYRGPLRLRQALASGRLVPAAQALSWVGAGRALETGLALGLPEPGPTRGLALAESGYPASLLALSRAYAAIGNGGALAGLSLDSGPPQPATVRRIHDAQGREVYAYEPTTREALDPMLAFLVNDMLSDSAARCADDPCPTELPDGRAALVAGEPVAGATWAIGYTPERLIGVWVEDDGQQTTDDGQNSAEPLWRALMAWAGGVATAWPRPAGLRRMEVCVASGLLPSSDADCATVREWFVPGTEPSSVDTMTREVAINRETGRLATIFTLPQLIERREYIVYPPEAATWATEAGIETPPVEYDTIRRVPTRDGGAAVSSPEAWSVVSGQWSVVGSAAAEKFASYRLAYFPGLWPEAMQLIAESQTPVVAAELAVWDTIQLEDGLYTLLLTVIHQDGTFDEVAIPVTVANGK
jgi:membrane peptidoglycan carboxypeptidase